MFINSDFFIPRPTQPFFKVSFYFHNPPALGRFFILVPTSAGYFAFSLPTTPFTNLNKYDCHYTETMLYSERNSKYWKGKIVSEKG